MRIKRVISRCFIFGGLLLLAAALCLAGYNFNEQMQASRAANDVLQQLESRKEQSHGLNASANTPGNDLEIPDYLREPEMPMPEAEVNAQSYIGVLTIPELGLELPIISQWSYVRLKLAPCRYQGSAYTNNLIVMAHNYASHFGNLKDLQSGDDIFFEDMEENVFHYQVVEKEILDTNSYEEMVSGDWDLTLFTCTPGGKSRVTVRCEQVLE